MMDLSDQVFCDGMAYVALSSVKQLENLHLIAFTPQSIKVSTKCLQQIYHLHQTYRADLPQYIVLSASKRNPLKHKQMLTGKVLSHPPPCKHSKQGCVGRKRKVPSINDDKHLPPNKLRCNALGSVRQSIINIPDRYRYNPVSPGWQRQVCREHGLRFVCANKCKAAGPKVRLKRPTSVLG